MQFILSDRTQVKTESVMLLAVKEWLLSLILPKRSLQNEKLGTDMYNKKPTIT